MRRSHLLAILGFVVASPALADQALDKAKAHYAAGVEHFKAQRYDQAIKELEAAYALKPIPKFLVDLAKTHLKKGDKAAALKNARQFLRQARVNDPDRPTVEQMAKDLEAEVGKEGAEVEVPQPVEVPGVEIEEDDTVVAATTTKKKKPTRARRNVGDIIHTPVDEAKVARNIPIVAELPNTIEATRVVTFYRDAGRGRYVELPLEQQGYAFIGEIPGSGVLSSSLQYYIEAYDAGGKVLASSGNIYSPHIVVVEGGRRPRPEEPEGPPPPKYRKWTWALGISGGVFAALAVTFTFLARDRQSAIESAVDQSQQEKKEGAPLLQWDYRDLRDNESQGKKFANFGKLFTILGGVTLVGAGTLWYLDYRRTKKYVADESPMTRIRITPVGIEGEF